MSTVTCDETLGSRPSMLKNYCHTSIATQSSNQSIEARAYQIPRNISSGQLHEILIAMSWASLICPDETDFLPSFLVRDHLRRRRRRRVKVVLVQVNACGWFGLWKLAKQGYSLQIAVPENHREAGVGKGLGETK